MWIDGEYFTTPWEDYKINKLKAISEVYIIYASNVAEIIKDNGVTNDSIDAIEELGDIARIRAGMIIAQPIPTFKEGGIVPPTTGPELIVPGYPGRSARFTARKQEKRCIRCPIT